MAVKKVSDIYVAPYPYNLINQIYLEHYEDILTEDQESALSYVLSNLTEKQRAVIKMRYQDEKTLKEVAKELGVTSERVRQIEHKAIRILRHPSRRKFIDKGYNQVLSEREDRLNKKKAELDLFEEELKYREQELDNIQRVLEDRGIMLKELSNESVVVPDFFSCSIGLADMDLSVRSYNCLYRAGCSNLRDVISLIDRGMLLKVRNLGRKSTEEILSKIQELVGINYRSKVYPNEFIGGV